jgi:Zn-dependent peptidase ImmA (M78 family)
MNQVPAASQVSSKIDQLLAFHATPEHPSSWIADMPRTHRTRADADVAATAFRKNYFNDDQLGPMLNLPEVLDELGVVQLFISGERIEGASSIVEGVPFVFVSPRFAPRMLFTLGHELGHLIVHQDDDFAAADEELAESSAKGSQGQQEERYCHWFASSLLLPAHGVGMSLKRFRANNGISGDAIGDVEILFLSHFYGVSFFAAAHRCEELALLPRGGALSLYQALTKEYKNPEARAAEIGFPQRERLRFPDIPQVLVEKVLQAIQKGEVSIGKAASLLNVSLRSLMAKNADNLPS